MNCICKIAACCMANRIKTVLNQNTSSKAMYNIVNNKIKIPKAQTKYAGLIFDHHMWTKYYLIHFKYTKDTTLLWFKYRLINKILGTNTFLHMINCIDLKKNTFYNNFPETLPEFWGNVEKCTFRKTGIQISFSKNLPMFEMMIKWPKNV